AVIVGGDDERTTYRRNMAAAGAAPAPAKADRAGYYAKGSGARSSKDLVVGSESGAMSVEAVAPADLPEDLRAMDKAVLKHEIATRAAVRAEAQSELTKLSKQREEYLRANKPASGFDGKVNAVIDAQLKK